MKTVSILLSLILLVQTVHGAEQIKEKQLAQVAALYQEEGKAWPGLKWSEAPLILSFGEGEFYALGLKAEGFEQGETYAVAKGDEWGFGQMKMHPAFEIGGQAAFFFKMSGERAVKILAHERFHRYQMDRFQEGEGVQPRGYKQHLNAENVALMGLEEELLREFVQQGRLESIREYAAVYQERAKLLDEESVAWEEMQLRMEGMADYVAAKMMGDEKSVLAKSDEGSLVENAMKWRNYGVGAALGLALDALKVEGWKEQVEKGVGLNGLLQGNLKLSNEEKKQLVAKAKTRFQFKRKRKQVAKQVAEYTGRLDALKAEHESKEGFCVKVGNLYGVGISGGGRSDAIYYLEDGSQVSVKDQSVSHSMDGRWSFSTKEPTTLYQAALGYREVKAAQDLVVKLDGADLGEEEGPKEYLFNDLQLESSDLAFAAKEAPGVLVKSQGALEVWFFE